MIGTILLNSHNHYLVNGKLPLRPEGDKDLLRALVCQGLVSQDGYNLLPESIQKRLQKCIPDGKIAITIPELGKADILLVNRAIDEEVHLYKEFRLDNHHKVAEVEVWLKNL